MPNNNVALLSIMSKFDEKSAREAAKRADKVYEEALSDIGNVNFDKKLIENFDKAMNLLKNKFKKVNLSSYTNSLLDSIFSNKDITEKSKDIESFINKIEMLKKASSGQDINAFNTFSAKQIDALISRTEKLAQKQEEINEKTREYNREATKIAKVNKSISTIDKNYGNQDYSNTLESLKKSLGTEKEFTAEQNQSIENLAKMVNLYQIMEKSEPQKGTAEAIRYSKDLLTVTRKIKEERDKIDSFSQKGASAYIANNGLSSIDKVSDYTVNKSKEDFVQASLSSLKSQEEKLQIELTTYISDTVQKNLEKVSKEVDAVVDKAEKRVENLQNKIESLQTKSTKTDSDNSVISNIISESDIKTLEEIEDRLYAISDLDADGEATNQQLKEYIQLYKQYEKLVANNSTVKFDPSLKEEYDFIIESDSKLKKYADTLDETIAKEKELNVVKSDENEVSVDTQTEQLVKQEEQAKETAKAEKNLSDIQDENISNIQKELEITKNEIIELSSRITNLENNSFPILSNQIKDVTNNVDILKQKVSTLFDSFKSTKEIEALSVLIHGGNLDILNSSEYKRSDALLKNMQNIFSGSGSDYGMVTGGGIFGLNDMSGIDKTDINPNAKWYAIDYSKYHTYMVETEQEAEELNHFMQRLNLMVVKNLGVDGKYIAPSFQDMYNDVDIDGLFLEYQQSFKGANLSLDEFKNVINEIAERVKKAGFELYNDDEYSYTGKNARVSQEHAYDDDISTMFYKKHGYQGFNAQKLKDSDYNSYVYGSTIFDIDKDSPYFKVFETYEEAVEYMKQVRDKIDNNQTVFYEYVEKSNGKYKEELEEANRLLQEQSRLIDEIQRKLSNQSNSKNATPLPSDDKSNISSENIIPIEDKIQDVGNGTKRIISEIGMSYDDFVKKVKSDNSLEERFAVFDKYGKVIESLKGDINSLVLPDNMNTFGASKIVHTHPSMNALGGTLSEDDYLQWYSKFISNGIGEQFELLWRGKSLNIDLSNVKEELRSSVISALVNISHVAGLQLEKSDGEIPLPLSDIYNSLSNGLLKDSVEKSGGNVTTEIIDETKNKVQNIEALISILDDFGNFRRINLGNDDAIVERIEQYKSVLKFLSEHEEYTYDQVQKILANERMTIIGTNSQGLTHNGMQLKNNTAEWMSEYLADSYSKISNLSVDSSNFDPFNMSSDAERTYADITCKYYDAIAEAMDYVVREALEGQVSENDFVSSAMSSITGEIGSLDDDEMLQAFLDSKEHVQEYIQSRFDALKTSMDASPMIEVKKDEQSVEEQSKETANAIDEMIAKFSSTEIENMAKALTQCMRGLSDFDEMAKSLGVTVDDLYTAQDIFNNKGLFNSLSKTPIKDVIQGDDKAATDASTTAIKEESQALEQVSTSAKEAATSKEKFANSNKEVKASAESSSTSLDEEKKKIENVGDSAEETKKKLDDVVFKPNTEGFDEIVSKLDIAKDKIEEISKITKSSVWSESQGKYLESYNIKYKNGTSEIRGESSNKKGSNVLRVSEVAYDAKAAEQEAKAVKKLAEEKRKLRQQEKQSDQSSIDKALKDQVSAWKQIQSIRAKIAKTDNADEINALQKSKKYYQEQYINANKILKVNDGLYDKESQIAKLEQIRLETNSKIAGYYGNTLNSISNKIPTYTTELKKYNDRNSQTSNYSSKVEEYTVALNKLQTKIEYFNANGGIKTKDDVAELKLLQNAIEEIRQQFDAMSTSEKGSAESGIKSLLAQLYKLKNTYKGMSKEQKETLDSLAAAWGNAGNSLNLEEAKAQLRAFEAELERTETSTKTLWSALKDKAFYNFANQLGTMFSFYDIINVLIQAGEAVIELNTNITELAKVSEASASQIYDDFNSYAEIAKEVGGTISDTISATADWSRNGYNIPDAKELAEVAMIYKNVGDGIDIDTANEYLISTLRGFNLEAKDAMDIIDSINEVANNEPISSAGIGDALQRSAAAFNAANTSLQESIALVTSTNSVLQSPEKVGSMWTTVSARIRGATTELEEAGLETDGMVESTSKLQSMIKGMTGFDILEADGKTFKSIYDIIVGIGDEFQNLNDIDQAALLEALAGKRQSNALAATLNNIDLLKKAYGEATNAEGSAMTEQEKYQESIQFSIDRTKASLEELANDFMSSDFLKGLIDSGDKLINLLDLLIDKFGVLGSLTTVGAGIFGAKGLRLTNYVTMS